MLVCQLASSSLGVELDEVIIYLLTPEPLLFKVVLISLAVTVKEVEPSALLLSTLVMVGLVLSILLIVTN